MRCRYRMYKAIGESQSLLLVLILWVLEDLRKSSHIYLDVSVCLKVRVVPFVALESLKLVASLQLKPSKTSTKSDQGCPWGGVGGRIGPRG